MNFKNGHKMKKLILIFIATAIGICSHLYWRNNTNTNIIKDAYVLFPDTASENEKASWLTYSDPTAKYSLKYPSGFKINPINDRAVYFNYKDSTSMVNFVIFYQDTFDGKPVTITNNSSFKDEVSRRIVGLFRKDDEIVGHEISFQGKPAIVMENKTDSSREIFIWQNNQILQIEISGMMQKNESLLSKVLSTLTLNQ